MAEIISVQSKLFLLLSLSFFKIKTDTSSFLKNFHIQMHTPKHLHGIILVHNCMCIYNCLGLEIST